MFHCSHPNALFQPHLHPRGCSGEYLLGLGCQGCSGACSTPFSRLLQPSVSSVVDLGVMAFGHHPLPSHSLCGRVTLSVGVHSVCAPVSKSGGLAGLLRSQGSVSSSTGSSCFSSLSSLRVTWHGLPVPSSVLWPLHGSAGLHLGHGSCFSYTPFSGYPYASIPQHLAGPVFLSGVSPRGSSDCPPTLSRFGDCHPSQEFQPHTFPGSAVSVGLHRFYLFQGFSVGGTHLTAAIYSRRISVMRLAYREPVTIASRRSFLAGSPRSWRLTGDVVPPALPPSFLVPSGSGGSSVTVDDVSSSSPVLAPSTLSVSRGISPPGVSWPTLLIRHLGRKLGRPSRLSGRFRPVGPQQTALSINAGELLAIQLGLFQFRSALQGRTVPVFCDNTTAGTSLRKEGGTWSPLLNTLAQAILRWMESLSIRLAPQFLPGSDNVLADALSRPHQLPHPEWSIHMTVFLSLRRLWPVQIVFFATSATHRGSIYFSPFRDPRSAGKDAFLQYWEGLQAYAFHPVAVIRVFSRSSGPPRGRNSLLWLSTGLSALGFRTWSSSRWLLQWSYRPVQTSCACLGLVISTRISVGSGFMPGDSSAFQEQLASPPL